MLNTGMKIDEITQLMFTNGCLMELMQGYCLAGAEYNDSIQTLLPAFEILLSNHKKIWNDMDDIETDVLTVTHPDFFK